MEGNSGETGLEFVLDNRKLIVGFVLLMLLCGAFFIFGYMEGKRQALRADSEAAAAPAQAAASPAEEGPSKSSNREGIAKEPDRPVREQLDWYKSVNQGPTGEKAQPKSAPVTGKSAPTPPAAPPASPASENASKDRPEATSAVSYSVQVGAFKDKKEAEKKGTMLAEKGYDYVIDPPRPGQEYYLLKVGLFDSRADAVAMQLKLKRDGFATLIKTN